MLPKGCGISFDGPEEVDAWFVGSNADSEPRPSPVRMSPLAMHHAVAPRIAGTIANKLGACKLLYDQLDLTLVAVNRERAQRGVAPLA